MKNLSSFAERAFTPALWLCFHGALILAFLLSCIFLPQVRVNTSLLDILPPSHELKNVASADAKLSGTTSRTVTILAYAQDFAAAKAAQETLYARYAADETEFFASLSLHVSAHDTQALRAFLLENRFMLLSADTISLLEGGQGETLASDALSSIYGAFSLTDFSTLEQDPFNVSGEILMRYVETAASSSSGMGMQEGVLASQKDGIWYVMMRGVLTERAAGLQRKHSAVRHLYASCAAIEEQTAEGSPVHFAFSGVPFHSYESATSAERQVSVISAVGIVLIVALFLFIFRSLVPAVASTVSVVLSSVMALLAVLLLFREIHVLTFVFGTTLMGTCLDYSIHFFVHWKTENSKTSATARILRGIAFSFISTEICFAALFLAPFPFLKQVSVFLFIGLLSSFLSVLCLYPHLPHPRSESPLLVRLAGRKAGFCIPGFLLRAFSLVPLLCAVAAALVLFFFRAEVRIDNNLRDMYTMSPEMLENEKRCAQVLDYGSAGWYYIVEGESAEAVLQAEERFAALLDGAKAEGKLGSYLATSTFIPSRARQEESYHAGGALLPLSGAQYAALGFPPETQTFADDYANAAGRFIAPPEAGESRAEIPAVLQSVLQNLWLGKSGARYYSCVLPLQVHGDEAYFRALSQAASESAGDAGGAVYFVNKVSDIGRELNVLTATMIKLLLGAFVLVIAVLAFCYPLRTVLRIAVVPLVVALVSVSVLVLTKTPIGFFSITGLVLVFGLGLDYIIYAVEGERSAGEQAQGQRFLNNAAIVLSFLTTALSFGALAFISFAPVHTIGITVFSGLTTACVCAFASAGRKH